MADGCFNMTAGILDVKYRNNTECYVVYTLQKQWVCFMDIYSDSYNSDDLFMTYLLEPFSFYCKCLWYQEKKNEDGLGTITI